MQGSRWAGGSWLASHSKTSWKGNKIIENESAAWGQSLKFRNPNVHVRMGLGNALGVHWTLLSWLSEGWLGTGAGHKGGMCCFLAVPVSCYPGYLSCQLTSFFLWSLQSSLHLNSGSAISWMSSPGHIVSLLRVPTFSYWFSKETATASESCCDEHTVCVCDLHSVGDAVTQMALNKYHLAMRKTIYLSETNPALTQVLC